MQTAQRKTVRWRKGKAFAAAISDAEASVSRCSSRSSRDRSSSFSRFNLSNRACTTNSFPARATAPDAGVEDGASAEEEEDESPRSRTGCCWGVAVAAYRTAAVRHPVAAAGRMRSAFSARCKATASRRRSDTVTRLRVPHGRIRATGASATPGIAAEEAAAPQGADSEAADGASAGVCINVYQDSTTVISNVHAVSCSCSCVNNILLTRA